MFKKYGLIGLLLILFVEVNFFLKIQPFADWYFPIAWIGFILVVDACVYKLKKESLLVSRPWEFLFILAISIPFWYVFEFFNIFIQNWYYTVGFTPTIRLVSAAFIFPAVYEVYLLLRALHLFDKVKLQSEHKISKWFLFSLIGLGVLCFITPIFLPRHAFPLVWLSFFLILDPINYLHKQPSIIGHLKDRKLVVPLCLVFAGLIAGIFWEFWNYWAMQKWFYTVPFIGFAKVFEMPLLGYLGYIPFAFELYAMYNFVRSLFWHKDHLLE